MTLKQQPRANLKQQLRAQLRAQLTAQLDAAIRKAKAEGFQAGYEAAVRDLSKAAAAGVPAPPHSKVATDYVPKPPRGTNAKIVLEVLRSIAPRAAGPTEILATVKKSKGIEMPFTSVRHAINQLEKKKGEIEQVDDTKTWRIVAKNSKSKHG
jgi:hypothetical protein